MCHALWFNLQGRHSFPQTLYTFPVEVILSSPSVSSAKWSLNWFTHVSAGHLAHSVYVCLHAHAESVGIGHLKAQSTQAWLFFYFFQPSASIIIHPITFSHVTATGILIVLAWHLITADPSLATQTVLLCVVQKHLLWFLEYKNTPTAHFIFPRSEMQCWMSNIKTVEPFLHLGAKNTLSYWQITVGWHHSDLEALFK